MILVDTSAWIEFDRAMDSAVDRRLTELISADEAIAVTEPVIMEVVAGVRDDRRERDLRRLLARFELLRFDAAIDFDGAAHIYRTCRRRGVMPRGMVDCLIVAVARRHGAALLCADRDLVNIAEVFDVPLDDR